MNQTNTVMLAISLVLGVMYMSQTIVSANAQSQQGSQQACPPGTTSFSGGQCVITTTSTPATCTGTLDTQTGQCTTTTVVGQGACPNNEFARFLGIICGIMVIGSDCPSGYHLVRSGVCQSDTTPLPVCSSGTLNRDTGNCETTTTTNVCQSPAVYQNGQCVTTTTTRPGITNQR